MWSLVTGKWTDCAVCAVSPLEVLETWPVIQQLASLLIVVCCRCVKSVPKRKSRKN